MTKPTIFDSTGAPVRRETMTKAIPVLDRFSRHIEPELNSGCLIWSAKTTPKGYGQFKFRGTMWQAHRASWVLFRCEIPDGLQVLHRCDTPACVNPNHLWLGTNEDNYKDKLAKGRQRCGHQAGEDHQNSKFTVAEAEYVYALYMTGMRQKDIGIVFGVTQGTIGRIVRGEWGYR